MHRAGEKQFSGRMSSDIFAEHCMYCQCHEIIKQGPRIAWCVDNEDDIITLPHELRGQRR